MQVALEGSPVPLQLTRSPRLDNALRFGWESFARSLAATGAAPAAQWLAARLGDPELAEVAEPLLAEATGSDAEAAAEALFALAELAEESADDLLADTLWEGVLEKARQLGDGDAAAEATRRLAALAERLGDPLADTATGAGHEGDFAVEAEFHGWYFSLFRTPLKFES